MKLGDYTSRSRLEALHCPVRAYCSLAFLCGAQLETGKYALPVFSDMAVGEMMWTDRWSRRKVFAVRQGLLLSRVYANKEREVPHSLFGPGMVGGIPDIYLPYVASDFCFFTCLVPGRLCTFDGELVRNGIDALGVAEAQLVTARVLTNITTSSYGQTLTLSHRRVREKVVSVLLRMAGALRRPAGFDETIAVTHDDIAFIADVERATASKVLKQLADEGYLELGYRRVKLLPTFYEAFGSMIEANLPFYDNSWGTV